MDHLETTLWFSCILSHVDPEWKNWQNIWSIKVKHTRYKANHGKFRSFVPIFFSWIQRQKYVHQAMT